MRIKKPSPMRGRRHGGAETDEGAANLRRPLSQPSAASSPGRGAKGCASPDVLRIERRPLFLSKIHNSMAGKRLFFLHYCFFTLAHQYGKLLAR